MHTLIPAMIFRDGELFAVLGTSGADGQPQTQLQMMTGIIDFGLDIQEAIEAPRWLSGRRVLEDSPDTLSMESRIRRKVRAELAKKGHEVRVVDDYSEIMGTAQGITIDPETRVLSGWADPRGDGLALGW
jgi:gamma-glutamyltranspeptidase/glutathione hydrolase